MKISDILVSSRKRIWAFMIFGLVILLFGGGLLVYYQWQEKDADQRSFFLDEIELLSQSLNPDRIKALTGSESDLTNSAYIRIKQHLSILKQANPEYRFVYLVGRKMDGSIFFYIDNESPNSPDYSPPGQVYTEAPEGIQQVFKSGISAVSGIYTDRCGQWLSAHIPFKTNACDTGIKVAKDDAYGMVKNAVEFYHTHGRKRLLEEVSKVNGMFQLYAFVYDPSMTVIAHPVKPSLIGVNVLNQKDWSGGKYFRREIQELALSKGKGWMDYQYENPVNGLLSNKVTYFEKVGDVIICAGAYQDVDSVYAVLGVDIDHRLWNKKIFFAVLPTILFVFTLIILFLIEIAFLYYRSRLSVVPLSLRRLESSLILATGFAISIYAAWQVHEQDIFIRNHNFFHAAEAKMNLLAKSLENIRDVKFEFITNAYSDNRDFSENSFLNFTQHFLKNNKIYAWEWVPAVPLSEKAHFEEEQSVKRPFKIWEKSITGEDQPVVERPVYYPITYIIPTIGNEQYIGFDQGSEELRRNAINETIHSRFPTCTPPVTLVKPILGSASEKIILIFNAVFDAKKTDELKGLVASVIRFNDFIQTGKSDNQILLECSYLHPDGSCESLARSWRERQPPRMDIQARQSMLIFGKTFLFTAYPSEDFLAQYSLHSCWFTLIGGGILTIVIATLFTVLVRSREDLEEIVTKRTQSLHESENRFNTLFNSMPNMVFLKDRNLKYVFANRPLLDFFNKNANEVIGKSDYDFMPEPSMANAFEESDKEALRTQRITIYQETIGDRILETHKFPVYITPDNLGVGCYITDVSQREFQQYMMHRAMIEAEEANHAKSAFLATMSHEIRTPLNAVIGMSSLLLTTKLDDRQTEYAKTIISAGDTLMTLINNILDYSKIEAGKFELESAPFDLSDTVMVPLKIIAGKTAEKGIELTYFIDASVPSTLIGDSTRIRQVLLNFLSNAVKFTHTGEISLKVNCKSHTDNRWNVHFSVVDSGIGIDPETVSKLFQPFVQADSSTTRKFGGTGLGLAICKRIVEEMGGEISVQSEIGKGSTFSFNTLLSAGVNSGKISHVTNHSAALDFQPHQEKIRQLSVLVVDDNPVNLKVMEAMFNSLGHRTVSVINGIEAVHHVTTQRYDVVFMDMQMPEMDGLTATRQICEKLPTHPQRPIIVALTANVLQGDRELCIAAGMDDYLPKPMKIEILEACISKYFGIATNPISKKTDSPADFPVFDPGNLQTLMTTIKGQALELLLNDLLSDFRGQISQLQIYFDNKQTVEMYKLIHSFIGGSGMLGMTKISRYCSTIQRNFREGKETEPPSDFMEIVQSLGKESIEQMEQWIQEKIKK